jgi:hypothetical protein
MAILLMVVHFFEMTDHFMGFPIFNYYVRGNNGGISTMVGFKFGGYLPILSYTNNLIRWMPLMKFN